MDDFVRNLVNLTYCSTEYAVAAWHTLTDGAKEHPEQAAREYVQKFGLNRNSFD